MIFLECMQIYRSTQSDFVIMYCFEKHSTVPEILLIPVGIFPLYGRKIIRVRKFSTTLENFRAVWIPAGKNVYHCCHQISFDGLISSIYAPDHCFIAWVCVKTIESLFLSIRLLSDCNGTPRDMGQNL